MQSRMEGIIINDCPAFLAPEQNPDNHSIFLPDLNRRITLDLHGVASCFYVRKPTDDELAQLPIQQMTSPFPAWGPNSTYF